MTKKNKMKISQIGRKNGALFEIVTKRGGILH